MEKFFLFGAGVLSTALTIPWIKKFSVKFGYLDRPEDDPLKVHQLAVPHSAGIAFFWIFTLLILILFAVNKISISDAGALLAGGGLVFGLGVWDDLKSLTPYRRLVGQVTAGIILAICGVRIETFFILSLPLTIFYVVGAINAINMEDGLDGLAGGITLLSFAGFGFLSAARGEATSFMISSLMAGMLLGFLFYNFNPSSIFMGDNGSYFLGFVLAYLAVRFTSLDHLPAFLGPILVIGIPVLDAAYAIWRRLKKGNSPFTGDRDHFYDQLRQKGLTVRQTVLICWAIQAAVVGLGVGIYLL